MAAMRPALHQHVDVLAAVGQGGVADQHGGGGGECGGCFGAISRACALPGLHTIGGMKVLISVVPLLGAMLVGCAAPVEVRSVSAGGAAPAYELRGPRLAALDLQVRALCPQGHDVVRQSERLHRQTGDSNFMRRGIGWVQQASGFIEDEHAQLLVQCAPVLTAPVAAVAPPEPAPAAVRAASAPMASALPVR